mgnify:CR=1 FL=1
MQRYKDFLNNHSKQQNNFKNFIIMQIERIEEIGQSGLLAYKTY